MNRFLPAVAAALALSALCPAADAACTFDAAMYGTPSAAAVGQDVTFNAYAENFSGCSAGGTNRRYSIDYDGNGTYDCVTPWTGCYNSPCKKWCHYAYTTPGTHTPTSRIEWRNNSNGTVVEYASTTITVASPCTFTAGLTAQPASPGVGQTVTFNAAVSNWANCSLSGTNRRYSIDYDGNGTYDCVTPWTGCYNSPCKRTCQTSYASPATYNATARIEWANNSNGTVTQYASLPVAVTGDVTPPDNPATFTATIDGKDASGLWVAAADPVVELTWSAGSDPAPGSGVAGYHLVLDRVSDGHSVYSAEVGDVLSHTLATAGLGQGESYSYRIRTQDGEGNWAGFKLGGTFSVDTATPTQDGLAISSPLWQVDGVSAYDVTLTASDADSGLRDLRALINLHGANSANRRGYFAWSSVAYTWGVDAADKIACTGGGYASKYGGDSGTPPGWGKEFASLVGCQTSLAGGQRTVTLTVLPQVNFGDFSNNDISFWARDHALNIAAWVNHDLDFETVFADIVPPAQEALELSTMDWYANGVRTYDVTVTSSDPSSGVLDLRALINHQGDNTANRRGYYAWRETGYTWPAADSTDRIECEGGGYAEKYDGENGTPPGYGKAYASLVGCTTSVDVNGTRTVTFTIRPHEDFGEFENNDVSAWSRDHDLNVSGWSNFDLDFGSSQTAAEPSAYRLIVQDNLWFSDPDDDPTSCRGSNYCKQRSPGSPCEPMIPYRPLIGCTDSSDRHAKAQELQWLQRYTGRDGSGLVISQEWIKPDLEPHTACSEPRPDGIDRRLPGWLDLLGELGAQTKWNIFYDPVLASSQRCFTESGGQVDFDLPDIVQMWTGDLDYLASQYFDDTRYWRLNGVPVLYVWNAFKQQGIKNHADDFRNAIDNGIYMLGDVLSCNPDVNSKLPDVSGVPALSGATGFVAVSVDCPPGKGNSTTTGGVVGAYASAYSRYNNALAPWGIDFMPAGSFQYDDTEFADVSGFPATRVLAVDAGQAGDFLAAARDAAQPVAGTGTAYVFWGTANNWAEGTTALPTELPETPQDEFYIFEDGVRRIGDYGFRHLEIIQQTMFPGVPAYGGPRIIAQTPQSVGPIDNGKWKVIVDFEDCDYFAGQLTVSDPGPDVTILNPPDWTVDDDPRTEFSKTNLAQRSEFRYRWRARIDLTPGMALGDASLVLTFRNADGLETSVDILEELCADAGEACATPDSAGSGECCDATDFCNAAATCQGCFADGSGSCTAQNADYVCCSGICTDGTCGAPPPDQCSPNGEVCPVTGPADDPDGCCVATDFCDGSNVCRSCNNVGACSEDWECCDLSCVDGQCGALCVDTGEACSEPNTDGDGPGGCCEGSDYCAQGGLCHACREDGENCSENRPFKCCSGVCTDGQCGVPRYCQGQIATIVGTPGPDVIEGTDEADVIHGLGGDDVISGRMGNDVICGGTGADVIYGDRGNDWIAGGGGADMLYGEKDADLVEGGPGADLIEGGEKADILIGGAGADTISGGRGADTLEGRGGADRLLGGDGADELDGGGGTDDCIDVDGTEFVNCEQTCEDEEACPP